MQNWQKKADASVYFQPGEKATLKKKYTKLSFTKDCLAKILTEASEKKTMWR